MRLYKEKKRGNRKALGRTDYYPGSSYSSGWRAHHDLTGRQDLKEYAEAYPGGNFFSMRFANPEATESFTVEISKTEAEQMIDRLQLFISNAKDEKTGAIIAEAKR